VLRFAVRANVASIALILAWRLDVFFVTSIRGAAELGQYAVAVTLAEVMLAVASSLRIALTPRQGQHKDRHLLVVAIARVTRLSVTTGLIVTVTLAPLAGRLMETLYGPRYGPAAGALVWLLPGIVALVAQGPLIDFLLVEERVRAVTGATVVGLVVNIGLNLALLPHHDFRAAAAASTVSYVVSCTWCVLLFRRHTGTRLRHLLIATPADVRVALSGHGTTASVTAPGPLPPS
jgi:O-antigen/teichoic acid export membrane protein